jgi:hypothetical protein
VRCLTLQERSEVLRAFGVPDSARLLDGIYYLGMAISGEPCQVTV